MSAGSTLQAMRESAGIYQNMTLAAFDTFVCVESTNATTFCCLDRLAIHDNNRRTSRAREFAGRSSAGCYSTHRRCSSSGNSDKLCSRLEILGEATAIGSPSAVDKRSRSKQHEGRSSVADLRAEVPVTSAQSTSRPLRSDLFRSIFRY